MQPSSRQLQHILKDRLSVDVVPKQSLNTGVQPPLLHWLFSENDERVMHDDDLPDECNDSNGFARTENAAMDEVTDWLESHKHGEFWVPGIDQHGKVSRRVVRGMIYPSDRSRFFLPPLK